MKNQLIQLVPNLITLETNAPKINCFTFWDSNAYSDFFPVNPSSRFKFNFFVKNKIRGESKHPELNCGYVTFKNNQWFYKRKLICFDLAFSINEHTNTMESNWLYSKIMLKVGRLESIGDIFTDYITYKLESSGLGYYYGAAAQLNNNSCLFFGMGKNFKTTLVNIMVNNGGYYIGEEFFVLDHNLVYATPPSVHQFDLRKSHKDLMSLDLKNRKVDVSEYKHVFFLNYSNFDKIVEVDIRTANDNVEIYQNIFNSYYYRYFQAKNSFIDENTTVTKNSLKNQKARYFISYFTDIDNVFKFIKRL